MARTAVVKIDGAYYLEKYSPDGREVMERHPVAYSEREYEEYDRENGEWKNPKNREKYKSDS